MIIITIHLFEFATNRLVEGVVNRELIATNIQKYYKVNQ